MAPAHLVQARQNRLVRALARRKVAVKVGSQAWAEVQAVLSRGDRRLAPVLAALASRVLSGDLTVPAFHEALACQGLQAAEFLRRTAHDAELPWRIVEGGVSASFLDSEYRLAMAERVGHRCSPARRVLRRSSGAIFGPGLPRLRRVPGTKVIRHESS